jgi:2-dehydro-3-deoxyphosphogluconate aldolase/(4S)-4-hydroxy-2-oxoglutarate aldolase
MSEAGNAKAQILATRIVAIIRLEEYSKAVQVAQALVEGGISALEFTLTGSGAIDAVGAVRAALGDAACVGVGSVLRPDQADAAISGGAEFLVTPALRPAVIDRALSRSTLVLAGGFTPTELLAAHEAGAELVKLFPARLGGPAYLKDLLAPMPFLKLVPTGGVSAENARDYLAAGASALGIGGNLVPAKAVANDDFAQITATARACVAALA